MLKLNTVPLVSLTPKPKHTSSMVSSTAAVTDAWPQTFKWYLTAFVRKREGWRLERQSGATCFSITPRTISWAPLQKCLRLGTHACIAAEVWSCPCEKSVSVCVYISSFVLQSWEVQVRLNCYVYIDCSTSQKRENFKTCLSPAYQRSMSDTLTVFATRLTQYSCVCAIKLLSLMSLAGGYWPSANLDHLLFKTTCCVWVWNIVFSFGLKVSDNDVNKSFIL